MNSPYPYINSNQANRFIHQFTAIAHQTYPKQAGTFEGRKDSRLN